MTVKERNRIIRAIGIAVIIYCLWYWREFLLGLFKRPVSVIDTVEAATEGLDNVPGITYPNYQVTLPPLSYTPNPYGPVIYNPSAIRSLNIGGKGCTFCIDYGDNALIPPTNFGAYSGG